MNKHEQRIGDYLLHMVEASDRICRYIAGMSPVSFLGEELVQDAVIRNIEVLGEAARKIMHKSPSFTAAHSEIRWQDIYNMRNRLSHGYDSINMKTVWEASQDSIPRLRASLQQLLAQLGC